MGAEDVHIVQFRQLLGLERFRGPESHMAGIVRHDIEVPMLLDDRGDAGIDRFLRSDIELDGVQIDAVVLGIFFDIGDLRGIAAPSLPHRGINRVAGIGQRIGGQSAKAAGSAGDEDDLVHGHVLSTAGLKRGCSFVRPCRHWREAPDH